MHTIKRHRTVIPFGLLSLAAVLLIAALWLGLNEHQAAAQEGSPLHPTFPLLDESGENVLASGRPVSTMQTCGACHDTTFIAEHSFHADVGLSDFTEVGYGGAYTWDTSPGLFGAWNPLTYRYLSPDGDERVDLTTAEWMQIYGPRHIGGGPAVYGRDGQKLTDSPDPDQLENQIVNPETGELMPWDWQASGVVEMNCFLCHFTTPNNQARVDMLRAGEFQWANTATLAGSGIVEQQNGEWVWNPEAFAPDGQLKEEFVSIQDPSNENCGQCHGLTHYDNRTPLVLDECKPDQWSTITTGQVFSPQFLSETGLNFENKEELSRPWDIHAERVVECTDCHYSLNNPVYFQESEAERPDNIEFDPRRIDVGEYLYRPVHDFAIGQSAQGELANTMRRCESCHDEQATHDWLPYQDRHMSALACESCHIPRLYAPARQTNDWTVLTLDSRPETSCRGINDGENLTDNPLLSGYEPILLPHTNADSSVSLTPYNLITSWYWVYGNPERPVPLRDLQAVWLDGDHYAADVLTIFDQNGDGTLDQNELVIDSPEKESLISSRLEARGLENPRIQGDVRPYSINHDVVSGDWAIKECETCHSDASQLSEPMLLADRVPYSVIPAFVSDSSVLNTGDIVMRDGKLYYEPNHNIKDVNLYVFGHDNVGWIDMVGAFLFLGTVFAVSAHSGMRYLTARRHVPREAEIRHVYMYSVYERQWHWLQTTAILLLIFTGLIIHKPELFGVFSFRYVVQVHNILAAILVINAALAAFYHFASGDIRQYLPRPHGFFDQSFAQARYYLVGIFKGEPHPLEKTRERKMNPLQQITYLAILNILLPLQVITGILMWGAQTWPDTAEKLGGLGFLAPLHTIVAWLFATFIVGHVYMTTTERTPLTGIKSMVTGWSELEVHHAEEN